VNFPIISGEVTFTVPENATACGNAIVVCMYRLTFGWMHFLCVFSVFGDSGNASPEFAII
jgi:hypothetical protein